MKVTVIQTSVGDYRQAFVDLLSEKLEDGLSIISGTEYFYSSLKTGVRNRRLFVKARNCFLAGRRVLWQFGVHRAAIMADVAVLEYNPRIINSWVVAIVRRSLGRRTILWGHVYSRRGCDNLQRRLLRVLANGVILYTSGQKAIMREQLGYKGEVFAAPNALYRRNQMQPCEGNTERSDFIYVGRLVKEKKPQLMLEGFAAAIPRLDGQSKLIIVGDGPEREKLKQRCSELGIESRVEFAGHVADAQQLSELYARCLASLSPGYVGLSITQSLGFGVPMIYARNEQHAPEIECARDEWNALIFESDDSASLAEKLVEVSRNSLLWQTRSAAIAEECRNNFSVEKMVDEFIRAINGQVE